VDVKCDVEGFHVTSVAILSCCCISLQIVFIGMLLGSNVWGYFSDRYGRRPVSEVLSSSINVWFLKCGHLVLLEKYSILLITHLVDCFVR